MASTMQLESGVGRLCCNAATYIIYIRESSKPSINADDNITFNIYDYGTKQV